MKCDLPSCRLSILAIALVLTSIYIILNGGFFHRLKKLKVESSFKPRSRSIISSNRLSTSSRSSASSRHRSSFISSPLDGNNRLGWNSSLSDGKRQLAAPPSLGRRPRTQHPELFALSRKFNALPKSTNSFTKEQFHRYHHWLTYLRSYQASLSHVSSRKERSTSPILLKRRRKVHPLSSHWNFAPRNSKSAAPRAAAGGEGKWSNKLLDAKVRSLFHELSTHCLPVSHVAQGRGYYRIRQLNEFTVQCDKDKTRPLFTFSKWTCDTKSFISSEYFVPAMCTEKKLPTMITMERKVTLVGLRDSKCGEKADLRPLNEEWRNVTNKAETSREFKIGDFRFTFDREIRGGLCTGSFLPDSSFRVEVDVTFVIKHRPYTFILFKGARRKIQKKLDKVVMSMLSDLGRRKWIESYYLFDHVLSFKAVDCADEGSIVQPDEQYFQSEIPPCRFCDRGMYLADTGKEGHRCVRCKQGHYSSYGSTKCIPCPLMELSMSVGSESLTDCFSLPQCTRCHTRSLEEAVTIIATYHVISIIVVAWNLRSALPNVRINENVEKQSLKRYSTGS